jgi:chromosome segregation ATPase
MNDQTQIFPVNTGENTNTVLSTCYYSSLHNSPYCSKKCETQNENQLKLVDSTQDELNKLNDYREEIDRLQRELCHTQRQVYQVKKLLIQLKFKNEQLVKKIANCEGKLNNFNSLVFSLNSSNTFKPIRMEKIKKSFSNVVRNNQVKKTTRTNLIVYEKVGANVQNILIDRSSSLYQSISISVSQSFNITNEIHAKCVKKPRALSRFIEFIVQKTKH